MQVIRFRSRINFNTKERFLALLKMLKIKLYCQIFLKEQRYTIEDLLKEGGL